MLFLYIILSNVSDPFHFGQPDPFHGTDPGSNKISQNHGKFQQKSTKITRILYIYIKNIYFCLTDININLINNKTNLFSQKYISERKKFFFKVGIFSDPLFHETDPRIRIHIKMKRIRITDFNDDFV